MIVFKEIHGLEPAEEDQQWRRGSGVIRLSGNGDRIIMMTRESMEVDTQICELSLTREQAEDLISGFEKFLERPCDAN